MGNQIVFPENNQLPRDLFSCGQSKQGVSLYHTNYQNRIDKMGVILNNGQVPLVKSRYLKYIYNEEHPYGINAIVAIGCYGGYNVEDSILFNEGSIKRGMFNTSYFNMYESREESSKVAGSLVDSKFTNIEKENVVGKKPGYDYSNLDINGLIIENTMMDDKKVVIGKITNNINNESNYLDASITPKKGQLGFVDKSFITDGEEGFRIAKVRIREERIPAIGDKFCSRCGQKGTVGLIIPEKNMPFTEDGIRPDLIINPHALPSRMTIGQLVETLMGKASSIYGGYGDCTAFVNKGPKYQVFGRLLKEVGYNSTGNELLYNGETGEQLQMELFIGPCYYMRLKHMVKDKINYRAQGPRTALTRQTVQGRANDGGLRIGEMERDGILGHGASKFLQESMMTRGDNYYVAICNNSGSIAIYNESTNTFISPFADGPLKFNTTLDDKLNIEVITKYGRSFSIIRVPYCFKLLMQELLTLNIHMRIITEDNVDNLTSMSGTKTIQTIKTNILNNEQMKELYKDEYDLMMDELDDGEKVTSIETEDNKKEMQEQLKQQILKDKENEDEEDDEEGLSQVTKDSIKRAEEEYERYKDLDDSSSDEDESKPPIKIEEPITDKLTNAFNNFVETLTPNVDDKKKEEPDIEDNFSIKKPETNNLQTSVKLSAPEKKSILDKDQENNDEINIDNDNDNNSSLKIKTPKEQNGGNKKSINFNL